jgi:hypothetical protein
MALTLIQAAKAVKKIRKLKKVEEVVEQPLKIPHPLNPSEVFTFPPGTDPKIAKEYVRRMLLAKARYGEQKIELPSELPKERLDFIKKQEQELEDLKKTVVELKTRTAFITIPPGIYQDDVTGKYYNVSENGDIEELLIDSTEIE